MSKEDYVTDRKVLFSKRVNTCRTERERYKALEVLKLRNLECMQNVGKYAFGLQPFQLASKNAIKGAEFLCKKMGLPLEIKMLSLEIFERFMINMFEEMTKGHNFYSYKVFMSEGNGFEKDFQKIFNSAPLYMVACVQVAAKFENRDLVLITPSDIVKYLGRNGYTITELDLMDAEMKIIKAMNFELYIITRYEAVEDLISTRRDQDFLHLSDIIFTKSIEILEMILHNHRNIFDDFIVKMGLNITKSEKISNREMQQAEYDSVWIAAASIVAATRLTKQKNIDQNFFDALSQKILRELADDLSDMRTEHELRTLSYVLYSTFINLKL